MWMTTTRPIRRGQVKTLTYDTYAVDLLLCDLSACEMSGEISLGTHPAGSAVSAKNASGCGRRLWRWWPRAPAWMPSRRSNGLVGDPSPTRPQPSIRTPLCYQHGQHL